MYKTLPWLIPLGLLLFNCKNQPWVQDSLQLLVANVESIPGNTAYLNTPYVTAGDRLYMVGHQNGQFPDLGWHVTGEMGGIWDHPVKLMDGFTAAITTNGQSFCLTAADTFINYPFANKHIYQATPAGLRVERFQFVPDGMEAIVVEYTFINLESTEKNIVFEFTGHTDLRPVWLGDRTGMKDGGDFARWDEATHSWIAKDSLNEWHVIFGAATMPQSHQQQTEACQFESIGKGCSASMSFSVKVPSNSSVNIPFTIAGSYQSVEKAKETWHLARKNAAQLLENKKERYKSIVYRTHLTIPDKSLEQAFRWLKYNTDWLIRDVPEIGRGLSAGLPDYPWWFGADNEYALQGLIATGRENIVKSTIGLLVKISEKTNGNGRIIHEVSTNGAVYNSGNINETPQFAMLIWTVYQWTGDKAFLKKYYPVVKKGLAWLLKENDVDSNMLPDGFGMMEIHGLNSEMIDVAVYTQKAFADASEMAGEMGETALSNSYLQKAELLKKKINEEFWVPEYNSYADFIGTTAQALHLIDDAIVRADTLNKPWAVAELKTTKARIARYPLDKKQGFVLHHNWVVNTPMETSIADADKALIALKTGSRFVNPYGVFVTGIDRDESAGKDENSFAKGKKVFSYTGAVMTLPTGVQAIAENNYGHPDKALDYLKRMTRTFSFALPGSIYEVSPDFGMMAQAWNMYSFAVPIVRQFFGIQPMASKKTVRIQPQMPAEWNEASLENVKVGENKLNIFYKHSANQVELDINQEKADWKLVVAFPKGKFKTWLLNGKPVLPQTEGNFQILEVSGAEVSLKLGK